MFFVVTYYSKPYPTILQGPKSVVWLKNISMLYVLGIEELLIGPSEGKRLEIDTVFQFDINANILKKKSVLGSQKSPLGATLQDRDLCLGEP